ncbi:MAG: hypothetical protein WBC26_00245 [Alphaproteobacteria bacterium]|jgi:hypothetical protein
MFQLGALFASAGSFIARAGVSFNFLTDEVKKDSQAKIRGNEPG